IVEFTIDDPEVRGSLLDENSARRVVASGGVPGPAVGDPDPIDADALRSADENGKSRHLPEFDARDGHIGASLDQDAVTGCESRKGRGGVRQSLPLFDRIARAVDGKIAKSDAGSRFHAEKGVTAKVLCHADYSLVTGDLEIVGAFRQGHFRVDEELAG